MGQPVIYRSTASVLVDPMPPSPLGKGIQQGGDAWGYYWSEQEYLQTQAKVLTSRHVASLTVRRLGLQSDPSFAGTAARHQNAQVGPVPLDAAASALQGRVDVKPMKGTRLITVGLDDTDPNRAQRLLGGVVETFAQQNLDRDRGQEVLPSCSPPTPPDVRVRIRRFGKLRLAGKPRDSYPVEVGVGQSRVEPDVSGRPPPASAVGSDFRGCALRETPSA